MVEEDNKLQLEESMDGGHMHGAEDSSNDASDPDGNMKNNVSATSEGQAKNSVKQLGSSNKEGGIKMNKKTLKEISKNDSSVEESSFVKETKQSSKDEDADTSNENICDSGSLMTSGKRDRKKVERLSFSAPEITKTKIEAMGAGLLIGDDPYIDYMFSNTKSEDLKFIHVLLYRRSGNKLEIKRNLRCFNGFSFNKEDEEFQSLLNRILKWPMNLVVKALRLFGQSSVGTKQELSERLADFLLCPTSVDKAVPARKGKGSSSKKKPAARKSTGKTRKIASGKKGSKATDSANGDDALKSEVKVRRKAMPKKPEYDSNEGTEDEMSDGSDGYTDEGEEAPARESKAKTTPVSKPAKKAKSTPAPKRKKAESDDLSDDEPLVKKVRKLAPTDDDIRVFLEGFMKSVDLEEITMKSIYQQVYDQYPGTDITSKKDFIKKTVKKMIA